MSGVPLDKSARAEADDLSAAAAGGVGREALHRLLHHGAADISQGLAGGADHVAEREDGGVGGAKFETLSCDASCGLDSEGECFHVFYNHREKKRRKTVPPSCCSAAALSYCGTVAGKECYPSVVRTCFQ